MMVSISDKQLKIQQGIILVAGVEFLVATLCLVQINPINPLHNGLRMLTMLILGCTAAYGFRLLLKHGSISPDDSVPVLRFPVRQLVRIGVSLITLPAIVYVGYGESLIALDSQFVNAYVKRVLEFAAVKKQFEGDGAANTFILRAAEAQGKRAEKLELERQLVKPFVQYSAYIDLMKVYRDDPHFGLGIMARLYDKVGETQKAEQLYLENEYYFFEAMARAPVQHSLVLEARFLDLLRYIPEQEALEKIRCMHDSIAFKNASALKLGQERIALDLKRTIYDCRGIDGPIGFGRDNLQLPVMSKEDVEWLLAKIGRKNVAANIPELLSLCPDWKASDFVFEYGVIPPLPFSKSLPDVFLNKDKPNRAPLSWRVPPSLSYCLSEDTVIMPISMCKKLCELAGESDGYQRRVEDGHICFYGEGMTYEQAQLGEKHFYKTIVRMKR